MKTIAVSLVNHNHTFKTAASVANRDKQLARHYKNIDKNKIIGGSLKVITPLSAISGIIITGVGILNKMNDQIALGLTLLTGSLASGLGSLALKNRASKLEKFVNRKYFGA